MTGQRVGVVRDVAVRSAAAALLVLLHCAVTGVIELNVGAARAGAVLDWRGTLVAVTSAHEAPLLRASQVVVTVGLVLLIGVLARGASVAAVRSMLVAVSAVLVIVLLLPSGGSEPTSYAEPLAVVDWVRYGAWSSASLALLGVSLGGVVSSFVLGVPRVAAEAGVPR